jgi:hypothetical protein
MVARAEDGRWSSLWRWRHPAITADVPPLTVWPVARPRQWLRQVNRPQNKAELATLQTAVQRGRPFGATIWQETTAKKLGLESTFQPRGRPKKYRYLDLSPFLPRKEEALSNFPDRQLTDQFPPMSDNEPLYIDCGSHGKRVATVVCCHMIESTAPVGFIENNSDPNDLQAWCEKCEKMFLKEGDKTAAFEAFNNRAIVCCDCYKNLKAQHSGRRK